MEYLQKVEQSWRVQVKEARDTFGFKKLLHKKSKERGSIEKPPMERKGSNKEVKVT
jgi:hypothetical protein